MRSPTSCLLSIFPLPLGKGASCPCPRSWPDSGNGRQPALRQQESLEQVGTRHNADHLPLCNDGEGADLVGEHTSNRLGDRAVWGDGDGEAVHDLCHREMYEEIADLIHRQTGGRRWQDQTDIAVTDHTDQTLVV